MTALSFIYIESYTLNVIKQFICLSVEVLKDKQVLLCDYIGTPASLCLHDGISALKFLILFLFEGLVRQQLPRCVYIETNLPC